MKLKMVNKAQILGYHFGKICRVIGTIMSIVFSVVFASPLTPLTPLTDDENLASSLNLWCIPAVVISVLVMMYGIWRTGGDDL